MSTTLARSIGAAVALACLVVGCIGSPSPSGSSHSTGAVAGALPMVDLAWNLTSCRELTAGFDVDSTALKAQLPRGFAPGPGMAPGKSSMGIDAFTCKSGSGAGKEVANAVYASYWATVVPPEAIKGDARSWFVKWDAVLSDAEEVRMLHDVGAASVRAGTVRFTDAAPLPGSPAQCDIKLEDAGAVAIAVGPAAPVPGGGGAGALKLREFTLLANDSTALLVWDATLAGTARMAAAGFADVPPGSMPAKLYGATRIPATIFLATSDLSNATIRAAALPD